MSDKTLICHCNLTAARLQRNEIQEMKATRQKQHFHVLFFGGGGGGAFIFLLKFVLFLEQKGSNSSIKNSSQMLFNYT